MIHLVFMSIKLIFTVSELVTKTFFKYSILEMHVFLIPIILNLSYCVMIFNIHNKN